MTGKIRFLHIPKTAGSTFDECLFFLYLRPYLMRWQFVFSGDIEEDRQRYAGLSPAARRRIAICTGHAPRFSGCDGLDSLPTVTLLRHPLDRVKSFCQHVSEGKSPQIFSSERQGPFDLDAFLASGRIQLNNFQSRMVLGEGGYDFPAGDPGAMAGRAMAVLQSDFRCYGITEDFDRSLLLFRQVLGWRSWPIYRTRNSSDPRARIQFADRHIARIEELNRIDMALYRLARDAFYQRLGEQYPGVEQDLTQFRAALARSQPRFALIDLARAAARLARRSARAGPGKLLR